MSVSDQRRYQVASDEAGPPGDDDPHHHHQFNAKRSALLEGSFPITFLSSETKFLSSIHDFETKSNPPYSLTSVVFLKDVLPLNLDTAETPRVSQSVVRYVYTFSFRLA